MAETHLMKIFTVPSLAAGATFNLIWKNPPLNTVLSYFAYPVPPTAKGSHGTSHGTIEITRISATHDRDNYNGDRSHVQIDILNSGTEPTGVDVWQSWVTQ
jgi:hypothetical protein